MTESDRSSRRIAILVMGVLLVALGVIGWWFRPEDSDVGQLGLARLLKEEEAWRREAFQRGAHINNFDLWEIQEEIAHRAGVKVGGLKGLCRRAANGSDVLYRAEGQMLAGNLEVAAAYFDQMATSARRTGRANNKLVARWFQRHADAVWRGGLADAAPALMKAVASSEGETPAFRRMLLGDLAMWHWGRANFRPERPQFELAAAEKAIRGWLSMPEGASAASLTAAHRLHGQIQLLRACLPGSGAKLAELQAAEAAFTQALAQASQETDADQEIWASVQHEIGLTLLEQRRVGAEVGPLAAQAADYFARAQDARPGTVGGGKFVDVRELERKLNAHIASTAFLAYSLALMPEIDPPKVREHAEAVLSMVVADDVGSAWLVAQQAMVAADLQQGVSVDTLDRAVESLRFYPLDQVGQPGVPLQEEVLLRLGEVVEAGVTGEGSEVALREAGVVVTNVVERLKKADQPATLELAKRLQQVLN